MGRCGCNNKNNNRHGAINRSHRSAPLPTDANNASSTAFYVIQVSGPALAWRTSRFFSGREGSPNAPPDNRQLRFGVDRATLPGQQARKQTPLLPHLRFGQLRPNAVHRSIREQPRTALYPDSPISARNILDFFSFEDLVEKIYGDCLIVGRLFPLRPNAPTSTLVRFEDLGLSAHILRYCLRGLVCLRTSSWQSVRL